MVKNIAIIPARGGSKRIPHKNIIDFFGKPLIAWTIEAAQESGIFERVIVSTDDEQIAKVAQQYGAEVPFMRQAFADDYSPVSLVTTDALEQLLPDRYDTVVQLMANCPLRTSDAIRASYAYFIKHKLDFQLSCFPFGWMNPWWAYKLDEHNTPEPLFSDNLRNMRSQDQERLYCPTGAIWMAKAEKLCQQKTFYGDGYKFFPLSWEESVDIDDYEDLKMAKAAYLILHNEDGKKSDFTS